MTRKLIDIKDCSEEQQQQYLLMAGKMHEGGEIIASQLMKLETIGFAFLTSIFLVGVELGNEDILAELKEAMVASNRPDVAAHLDRFAVQWNAIFALMDHEARVDLLNISDEIYMAARDNGMLST